MSEFIPNAGPDDWKRYVDSLGDIIPDLNTPEGIAALEEYSAKNPIEYIQTKDGSWIYKNCHGCWCHSERGKT
jgi:hypothetical protein